MYHNNLIKRMKNLRKTITLLIVIGLLGSFSSSAFSLSSEWIDNEVSQVRLISPFTHNNDQKELILGLQYKMKPGWKTYWQSPGDGGFAQNISWENSTNIEKVEIKWPMPLEFEILGLQSLGYENEVIFPLLLKFKDKKELTNLDLSINYLTCKDICIPGNARIFLPIPAGLAKTTKYHHILEKTTSNLPQTNLELSSISNVEVKAFKNEKDVLIEIKAKTFQKFNNTKIFLHTPFGLPVVNNSFQYSADYKTLISSFNFDKKFFSKENFEIKVLLSDYNHNFSYIDKVALEELPKKNFFKNTIILYLVISFLGGLILNVMPCVLPVLSIKLMSVLNNDVKKTRNSFLNTASGIIFSFVLLGIFFSLLQKLNISVSWGMQFQQPYFIIVITAVIFLFMMNMFDQFQFRLPANLNQNKFLSYNTNTYLGDFFNGFFATLMATPCSAPFVGSAITAAFTQKPLISICIFLFMGIGMSTPYLLISFFPKLVSYIPKPGVWMQYIKYFLGFLLFLTVLWLSAILLNFFNYYFLASFSMILILLIYLRKIIYYKNTLSLILLIILFILPLFNLFQQDKKNKIDENWQDFISTDINELINDNNLVFVDITADWCATCQYNKLNVLNKNNIKEALISNKIILVRGDWTKPNKKINNFLNNYNRFGIPFNAFFSKKYPDGLILSELLSEKEILNTITKVKK